MKKIALLASAAVGFAVLSAPAFAQTTGTLGVHYAQVDSGASDDDTWGVDGGLSMGLSGNLALLLDATYDDESETTLGTAHLISRDANSAWGGFIGLSDNDVANAYSVGVEYAAFMNTTTLALAAGYFNADDVNADGYGIAGEYRIFLNDDLRIDLNAGFATVDAGASDSDNTSIGAGVEYRFANSPISLGANIAHIDSDFGDSDIIGATVRFDFGNGSLKARDRTGNTFGTWGGAGNLLRY